MPAESSHEVVGFKRLFPLWILLAALAGAAISAYLTDQHYRILGGRLESPSFCSFSKTFDCDAVNASRYSEIGGWPLSTLGMGFYLAVVLLAAVAFFAQGFLRRHVWALLVGLCLSAVVIDIYLFSILARELKVFCLLCLVTYGINVLCLVLALYAPRAWMEGGIRRLPAAIAAGWRREFSKSIGVYAGLFLALAIAMGISMRWQGKVQGSGPLKPEEITKLVSWRENTAPLQVDFELDASPSQGALGARVVVVEFSDFQCPFCKKAAQVFHTVIPGFSGKVRFVFKNYPLDRACNAKIKQEMHTKSCFFARAALCAKQQGKFWEMHDRLFAEGYSINYSSISETARTLGLKEGDFSACLESSEAKAGVERDLDLGNRVDVHSTPTIFINGRKLPGLVSPRILRTLIELELKQAS